MTEDDTIRVLKRISFYDMMKLYRTRPHPLKGPSWNDWFVEFGWTWDEFAKHWKEWNGGFGTYSDFENSKK